MQAPTTTTRKPTLKRGSKPYLFHIESRSRPGVFHVTDAYRMTCTCEAGRARRLCWHVRLAVAAYDWFKRHQAPAQLAPPTVTGAGAAPVTARPAETGMAALQAAFGE